MIAEYRFIGFNDYIILILINVAINRIIITAVAATANFKFFLRLIKMENFYG
jgi:hypothetical protein